MNSKLMLVAFTYFLITNTSCTPSKLPKYVELNDLRILSIVVDSPETGPGSSVTLTPIISDVNETSSLSFVASGCIDPGVSAGADPTCDNNPTQQTWAQGNLTSATNSDMAQNFTGSAPSFSVTIPAANIIFLQRSTADQFNGVSYLVTYRITNSRGGSVSSFKRILVSSKAAANYNKNPVINGILSNGTRLGANEYPLGGKYNLQIEIADGSLEGFTYQKSDGSQETRFEELTTTWFITDGALKYFRTTNNSSDEYTAPDSLSTQRKNFLISVTRDSRGGTTVKRVCGGC